MLLVQQQSLLSLDTLGRIVVEELLRALQVLIVDTRLKRLVPWLAEVALAYRCEYGVRLLLIFKGLSELIHVEECHC